MKISDSTHLIERPIFLDCMIRNAILNALAWTNGNQTEAANLLGISDRTMNYKMKSHGIPRVREGTKYYRGGPKGNHG